MNINTNIIPITAITNTNIKRPQDQDPATEQRAQAPQPAHAAAPQRAAESGPRKCGATA